MLQINVVYHESGAGFTPPADDIPGRQIGEKVGKEAFEFAVPYFTSNGNPEEIESVIYPNPVLNSELFITNTTAQDEFEIFDIQGRQVTITEQVFNPINNQTRLYIPSTTATGVYVVRFDDKSQLIIIGE